MILCRTNILKILSTILENNQMKILISGILILSLASCLTEPKPTDKLVQQRIEERKKEYLSSVLERCRIDAEARASLYVDSLLSEQIQISLNEDVYFPVKPEKPVSKNPVIIKEVYTPQRIFTDTVLVKDKNDQ